MKPIPNTDLAVIVATPEQVSDPMPAEDGAYVTANDVALREAHKAGWEVHSEGEAEHDGREVFVTVLRREDPPAEVVERIVENVSAWARLA